MLFILFKVKIYSELKWIWWLNRVGLIYIRFTTETQLNLAFNLVLELRDAFIKFLQIVHAIHRSCWLLLIIILFRFVNTGQHFLLVLTDCVVYPSPSQLMRTLHGCSAAVSLLQMRSVTSSSPALPISVWSRDTWASHDQSAAVQCSSVLGQWYVGGVEPGEPSLGLIEAWCAGHFCFIYYFRHAWAHERSLNSHCLWPPILMWSCSAPPRAESSDSGAVE